MINKLYLKLKKLFQDQYLKEYWDEKVEDFVRYNVAVEKGGIVLLGDSITDLFRINEFYFGKRIYNRGISGDTSSGVVARIKESVYDLMPEKVFLLIGTNDIAKPGYNENATVQNIINTVKGINDNCPATIICVESVYPVNENIPDSTAGIRTNSQIESLNDKIKKSVKSLKAEYIDIYPLLKDENESLKPEYTHDGLHLSGIGYKKIVEILKPYLDK